MLFWEGGIKAGKGNQLNKLVRKASSVVGRELDSLVSVADMRMKDRIPAILDNLSQMLRDQLWQTGSSFITG